MCAIEENNSMDMSEPTEKTRKAMLRGQRQKLMAIHARIKHREKVIKVFREHLKHGTFPKRMKSIRPYPKMNSSEAQAIVNAACDQVQCVILDQRVLEEQKKLTKDQERYGTLKEQRQGERRQRQKHPKSQALLPKKPKKPTMAQLQEELAILQANVSQLCKQLVNTR